MRALLIVAWCFALINVVNPSYTIVSGFSPVLSFVGLTAALYLIFGVHKGKTK